MSGLDESTPIAPGGFESLSGGYEILSELGAGSYGRVYRARQRSTGQLVAIKSLRIETGRRYGAPAQADD